MTLEQVLPLNEYQNYINLAAQAAIESIQQYEEYETLALPSHELLETKSEDQPVAPPPASNEEEEDYIVTTYKGRFQCPRPNCSKLYKNRNGLKYHLQKGSCRIMPGEVMSPDGVDSATSSPNITIRGLVFPKSKVKPFYCKKCTKRYKNLNGLKYHNRVEHPEFDFEEIKGII